jgi:tetratricopeptide (TPR) repeat protein
MIENIALTELIDKYLGGELKPEEKASFEKRLATEPALSEQVALHRQITASFKSSGRASMLAMLAEEDAKMPAYHQVEVAEEKPEAKVIAFDNRSRQMYYWAAAVVLLLLVPFIFIIRNNTSSDRIADKYFQPYEYQGGTANGDTADLSTKAMQYYTRNEHASAVTLLDKLLGNNTAAEAEVQFYKGNSHLALNHATEAIASFEAVLAMPANQYTEEAQWYLALSYIKAEEKAKAKELLNTIVDTQNHPFHKDATELLKKL